MKHLIVCIMLTVLSSNQVVLASCDPSSNKHIYESTDYDPPRYVYSVDCHIEFGRLIKVETERKKQVEHLKESIKLKDLAIDTSNKRIKLWQDTTYKVEDRLLKIERNNDKLKWLYFGLGILVMSGATYGASRLK